MDMQKYFSTDNLYKILQVEPTAQIQDSKYSVLKKYVKMDFFVRYSILFSFFSQTKLL